MTEYPPCISVGGTILFDFLVANGFISFLLAIERDLIIIHAFGLLLSTVNGFLITLLLLIPLFSTSLQGG